MKRTVPGASKLFLNECPYLEVALWSHVSTTKLKSCSSFSIITSAHFCNGCQIVHLDKRSLTKHFEKSKHKMYFKFSKNRKNICWKDMDFVMMQSTIGQKSTSFFSANQKCDDFDPIFFVAEMKYFWKVFMKFRFEFFIYCLKLWSLK